MHPEVSPQNGAAPTLYRVLDSEKGARIDAFLAQKLGVSRARAQKILETAQVGGKSVKSSYVVRENDEIRVFESENPAPAPQKDLAHHLAAASIAIPILWQDEHLLVLNKPRGIVVHEGAGEVGPTLVDILRAHNVPLSNVGPTERAGIVHRLDKDTSGAMIVAKTDAAHWKIATDFEARRIEKRYFALVNGWPPARGRIEAPIGRHATLRKKMAVVPGGRNAVTEYEIARQWPKFSALDINLLTGRTHQIRVHLAYIYFPVVGDATYGGLHRALDAAPSAAVKAAIKNLDGQALHAAKIGFSHPVTGEKLGFEAPLPPDIAAIVQALDESQ